ncbi:MAG: ABC transporter permease, partial [Polyangiaceae bacterium]|nr:ABC transporter permease [Polyangiaceae bacterium]
MKALSIVIKRLLWGILLVFGITTVAWGLTALLPGDPVRAAMGPQAAPADVERARKLYGLDDPIFVRYGRFLVRLVHSDREPAGKGTHASCADLGPIHIDLGTSFSYRKPIVDLIAKKFPASLELAIAASLIQALMGLFMGGLAAARRGGRLDHAIVGTAVALGAAPTFVVGLLLQYVFAHRLGAFPVDGGYTQTGLEHLRAI